MSNPRRLRRSSDRVIAGVCGGLAEFFGWDATAVRALYVFLSVISAAFPGALVYVILWWVMPAADGTDSHLSEFRQQ